MVALEDFLGREGIKVVEFEFDNEQHYLVAYAGEYPNAIMLHSTLRQKNPKEYAEMLVREIEHDLKT